MLLTLAFNCSCKFKKSAELWCEVLTPLDVPRTEDEVAAPCDSVVLRCWVIFATKEASS